MKPLFILAIVLLAAASAGGVAAQDDANTTQPEFSPGQNVTECTEQIDDRTAICSVDYEDGFVVLDLYSDRTQVVTLVDATGVMEGGEINRETRPLRADGVTTIRFRATESGGDVAITVDTGRVLYGIPVESRSSLLGGPWTVEDAQSAGIGAGLGTALMTLYLVARTVYGRDPEGERLA